MKKGWIKSETKFMAWHKVEKKMYWFDLVWGNTSQQGGGYIGMLPIEIKERQFSKSLFGQDNRILIDPNDCLILKYLTNEMNSQTTKKV